MNAALWLLTLHITANLVWIGSIACVGWLVAAAAKAQDRSAAVLARGLYLRVAMPAFLVSFLCGALQLSMAPAAYMHLHWFHAKLTTALVVIALHHILGAKAKRLAAAVAGENSSESMQGGRSGGILTGALLASAFLTVVFVIFKQTIVP